MSRKIRVLMVDDDALLRRLVPQQLERSGFEMAAAASGDDALKALREADYDSGFPSGKNVHSPAKGVLLCHVKELR